MNNQLRKRIRRTVLAFFVALLLLTGAVYERKDIASQNAAQQIPNQSYSQSELAEEALDVLEIKGRAPKTDYSRKQFGEGWASAEGCNIRNKILERDLSDVQTVSSTDCTVLAGILDDPYTGETIEFTKGESTSSEVQIDHVVALSDAWQKGAQLLSAQTRTQLANDPLNLLAVDGPTNIKKGDSDAASWLPPNKSYRCRYIARQIAVKRKYQLWVTLAERDAIKQVLQSCPSQTLPAPTG